MVDEDCLHDMGDPAAAARHVPRTLWPDAIWMTAEPLAGDEPGDNVNPVGRLYSSAASTMIGMPTSLDLRVGAALGAPAGVTGLSSSISESGFGQVRAAAGTPFTMILEARA